MKGSLTLLCNWLEVHPRKWGGPPQWKGWLKQGLPPAQGLHKCADDHLNPSARWWAEEAHLLPPWTEGHRILMDTPTASETVGCQHRCRGCRGSREKWLVPARLDMLIFKLTDPGAEVTYTLWRFDVDAFLKQYDASMHPHIFASLHGYPGKWACMLDEGKDISVQDLLMHMEKTFGNKRDYDAMIRTLYEVQQKEDETVEEYMLHIHDAVAVICHTYPECLPDRGRDLKKDSFYHGLCPYLHDSLSFAMAELPEREQARPTFDTLYTLAKKLEAGQPVHTHRYTSSSDIYREKYRRYPMLAGRVTALEEQGPASTDPVSGEDSPSLR